MGLAISQSGLQLTTQAGLKQSSHPPSHSLSFKGLFGYRMAQEAVLVVFDPHVWNVVLLLWAILPHLVFFVGTDCLDERSGIQHNVDMKSNELHRQVFSILQSIYSVAHGPHVSRNSYECSPTRL